MNGHRRHGVYTHNIFIKLRKKDILPYEPWVYYAEITHLYGASKKVKLTKTAGFL